MDRHSLQYVHMVSGQQSQLHNPNAIVNFYQQMQAVIARGSTPRKNFLIDSTTPRGDVVITEDSAMKSVNSWVTFKVTEGIQRGLHEWSVYIENQGETSDGSGLMLGIVPQNFNKYDSFISQGGGWCLSRAGKFYGNWRRQDTNVSTLTYGTGDHVVFLLNYDNATMMVRVGSTYVIGEMHNLTTEVFPAISLHYRQQVVRFEYHLVCENSSTKQSDWMQRGLLPSAAAFVPLTHRHIERMPLASYLYSEVFKDRAVERISPEGKCVVNEKDTNRIMFYDSVEASEARLVTLANAFAAVRRYTMPSSRSQFLSPHVSAEYLRQRAYDFLRRAHGDDAPLHDAGLNFWGTMVFNLFSSALQASDSNPMALSLIKSLKDYLLSMPPFSLAEVSRGRGSSSFRTPSSLGIAGNRLGSDVSSIFPQILHLGVSDICQLLETANGETKKELSPTQEALMELIVLIALQRGLVHEVLRVCRYLLRHPQQAVSRPLVEWLEQHDEVLQPSLELPDLSRVWRACKSSDGMVPTALNPQLPILSVAYGNTCLFVHTTDGISKWESNSQGSEFPFAMSIHNKEPRWCNAGVLCSSMATVRTHLLLLTDVMSTTGVAVVVYTMSLVVHRIYRFDDLGDAWPRGPEVLGQLVSAEGDKFLLVYRTLSGEPSTVPVNGAEAPSSEPPAVRSKKLSNPCTNEGNLAEVKVRGFSFTSFPTPLWTTILGTPRVSNFTLRTCLMLMKQSYIDLGPPDLALQSSGGYVTVELWIRFLDIESTFTLYQHGDKSTGGEVFLETAHLDGAFSIRGGYRHDTRGSCVVFAPLPPTTNHLFLHIALVFDGQWGLFFNGEQVAWNRQGPHVFLESPRRRWTIGNGCICELACLRVWRTNRTAREIARDYKHYLAGDEPRLVVQIFFNETSGNVLFNYAKCTDLQQAVCVGDFTHVACEHHPLRACAGFKEICHGVGPNGDAMYGNSNGTAEAAVTPFHSPIHEWRDLAHARCSLVRGLLIIATPLGRVSTPYPVQNGYMLTFFNVHSGFSYSSHFYMSSQDPAKCLMGCDPDGRSWELFEMDADTKQTAGEGFPHTVPTDKKKCIFVSMLSFETEEDVLTASPGASAAPKLSSLFETCSGTIDSKSNTSHEASHSLSCPTISVEGTCGPSAQLGRVPTRIGIQGGPSSVSFPDESNHRRERGRETGVSGPSLSFQPLSYRDLSIKLLELLGKRALMEPMGEVLQLFSPLADDVGRPCVQEIKKTFQEHMRWIKGPGAPRAVSFSSSDSEKILQWILIIFLRLIRRVRGYGLHPLAIGLNVSECDTTSELFTSVLKGPHSALPSKSLSTNTLNQADTYIGPGKQDSFVSSSPDAVFYSVNTDGTTLLAILHDIIFEVGTPTHSRLGQLAQQIVVESMSIFMPSARYRAAVLRDLLAGVSMTMDDPLPRLATHTVSSKVLPIEGSEEIFASMPLLDGIVCSFSSVCSAAPLLNTDLDKSSASVPQNNGKESHLVTETALKEIIDTQEALMKLCVMRQRSLFSSCSTGDNRGGSAEPWTKSPSGSPFSVSSPTKLQMLDKTVRFLALQDAISSLQLLLFSTFHADTSRFDQYLDKVFLRQDTSGVTSSLNEHYSRTDSAEREMIKKAFTFNRNPPHHSEVKASDATVKNWVRDYYQILFDFATESLKFSKKLLCTSAQFHKVHEVGTVENKKNSGPMRDSLESVLSELKFYVSDSVLHVAITAIPVLLHRSDASWFLDRLHSLIPLCKDVHDKIYNFPVGKVETKAHPVQDISTYGAKQNSEASHKPKEESALEALYRAVIFTTSCIATGMVFASSYTSSLSDVARPFNTNTMPIASVSPSSMLPGSASGSPLSRKSDDSGPTDFMNPTTECVDKTASEMQLIIRNPLLSEGVECTFFNAAHTLRSLPVMIKGSRRQKFLLDVLNANEAHWFTVQRRFDVFASKVPDKIASIIANLAATSIYLSNEPIQTTGSQSEGTIKTLMERVMRRLTPVRNELLLLHNKEPKCSTALSDALREVQYRCNVLLSIKCALDATVSDDILYLFSRNATVENTPAFPTQPRQRWLWLRRRLGLLAIRRRVDVYQNDALSLTSSIHLVSQVACSTSFSAEDLMNAYRERKELETIRLQGLTQLLHLMQTQPSCTENVSFLLSGGFGHQQQLHSEDSLASCGHASIRKLHSVEFDILCHFLQYTKDRSCLNQEGTSEKCESGSYTKGGGKDSTRDISPPVLCTALKLVWHPRGFAFLCKYHVIKFIFKTYASIFIESPQKCVSEHFPLLRETDIATRQHRGKVIQFQRKIKQTSPTAFKPTFLRGKDQLAPGALNGGDTDSSEDTLVRTPYEQAKYTALDCMKHLGLRCAITLQHEKLPCTEKKVCNAFLTHFVQIIMTEMDACLSYVKRSALEFQQHRHNHRYGNGGGEGKKTASVFSPELNMLLEQIEVFSSLLSTIMGAFPLSYKFRDTSLSNVVAATASIFYQIISLEVSLWAPNSSDVEIETGMANDTEAVKDQSTELKFLNSTKLSAQIRLIGSLLMHCSPGIANECFAHIDIKELCCPYISDISFMEKKGRTQNLALLSLFAFAVRCLCTTGISSLSNHALLALRQLLVQPDWAAELEGLAPIFKMDLKGYNMVSAKRTSQTNMDLCCPNGEGRYMNSWRLLSWVSVLGGWIPHVPSQGMRVYFHEEGNSSIFEGYLIDDADGNDKVTVVPTHRACGDMRDLIEGRLLHASVSREVNPTTKNSINVASVVEDCYNPVVWGEEYQVKRDFVVQPSPLEPSALAPYDGIVRHFIAPAVAHFLSDLHDRSHLMGLNSVEVVALGGFVQMAFQCSLTSPPLFDELLESETFLLIRRFACTQKPHFPLPMKYIGDYTGHALRRFVTLLRLEGPQNSQMGVASDAQKDKEGLNDPKSPKQGGSGGGGILPSHGSEFRSLLTHVIPEMRATLQAQQRIASLLSNSLLYYDGGSLSQLSDSSGPVLNPGTRPIFFHPNTSQFQGVSFLRDPTNGPEAACKGSSFDHLPWSSFLEEGDITDSERRHHAIASASRSEGQTSALCFCLSNSDKQGHPYDAKVVIEPIKSRTRSFPLWANAIAFEASILLSDQLFPELGDCCAIPFFQSSSASACAREALPGRKRNASVFSILTVYASIDSVSRSAHSSSSAKHDKELDAPDALGVPVLKLFLEKGNLKCTVSAISCVSESTKQNGSKFRACDTTSNVVECSLPLKNKHWNCFMHVAVIMDAQRLTLARAGEVTSVSLPLTMLDTLSLIFQTEGSIRQLLIGNSMLSDSPRKGDANNQNEGTTSLCSENEGLLGDNQPQQMVFITGLQMTNSTLFLKTAIKDIAEMVARDHMLMNLNDSSEGNACLFQLREGTGDTVGSFCRQFRGKLSGFVRWTSCPSHLKSFLLDLPDKPLLTSNRDEPFLFPRGEIAAFIKALDFDGLTLIATQLVWSLVIRLSQAAVKQAMLQSLSPDYRLYVLCSRRQERVQQQQQQQHQQPQKKDGELPALTESNYFKPASIFDHSQLARQLADLFSYGDEDYLPISTANLLRDFMRYVIRYFHSTNQTDSYDEFIEETAVTMKLMLSFEEEFFHMEIPLSVMSATGNANNDCNNSHSGSAAKNDPKPSLLMPLSLLGGGRGRVKIVTTMSGRCEQLTLFRDRALKNVLVKYPDVQGIWSDNETTLIPDQCMPWLYFSITPVSRPLPQPQGAPFVSQSGMKLCLVVAVNSLRGVVMDVLFSSLTQEIKKTAARSGCKDSSDVSKSPHVSQIERCLPAFLNASMIHFLANCGASSQVPKDHYIRYPTHAVNILACLLDLWAAFPHLQPYDHVPLHVSLSHINVSLMEALHHRGGLTNLSYDHFNPMTSSLGVYYSCVQSLFALMFNAIRLDCLWMKRSFRQRTANGWYQILKAWRSCATTLPPEEAAPCTSSNESSENTTRHTADVVLPQNHPAFSHIPGKGRTARRATFPLPASSFPSAGVDPSSETNVDTIRHTLDARYGDPIVSMRILQPSSESPAVTNALVSCTALGNGEWRVRRACGQTVVISSAGFSSGRFYFELRLTETEGEISVGVITDHSQLNKTSVEMIGAHADTWGYDIAHQCLLIEGYRSDLEEHVNWAPGDILGVMIDLEQKELIFLYHGKRIAELKMHRKQGFTTKSARTVRPVCSYFPCVSVNSCTCVVNLGEAPFSESLPLGFLPVNPKFYCNPKICLFWYAIIAVKWASSIEEKRANDGTVQQSFVPDSAFQTVRSYIQKYCEGRNGPLSVDILCSAPQVCVNRHTNEIYVENQTAGAYIMHADVAVHSGRWYYEILLKGIIDLSVGWVVAETNGGRGGGAGSNTRVLGDDSESWVIETERMVVRHNGRVTRLRHHNWREGDVLGCLLDCDSGSISFTVNGRFVLEVHDIEGDGILFKNVTCPDVGLSPVVKARYMRGSIAFLSNRRDLLYPPRGSYKPIGAEDVITDAMRAYYLSAGELPNATCSQSFSLSKIGKLVLKISRDMDINLHNFSAHGLCYALEPPNAGHSTSPSTLGITHSVSASSCAVPESEANTRCYVGTLQSDTSAALCASTTEVDAHSMKETFEILRIFSSATEGLMGFAQEVSIPNRVDCSLAYPVYISPFRTSLYRLRRFTLPYLGIRTIRHALQETGSTSSENLRLRMNRRKALATMQTNTSNSQLAITTRLRDSLFGQIFSLLADKDFTFFCRSRNLWSVSFYGEGADDVGGPYRESLSQLCSELMSTKLPLFIPIASQASDPGEPWDAFVIHPRLAPPVNTAMYRFIGRLMAGCLRGAEPLSLYFPSFIWKFLVGDAIDMDDLRQADPSTFSALEYIKKLALSDPSSGSKVENIDEELSKVLCLGGFVVQDGIGIEHEMIYNGRNVTVNHTNVLDYVRLMLSFKLNRLVSAQLYALREGFHQSVPLYAVSSLKWYELETLVCGQRDYDPDALLDAARYENLKPSDTRVVYLRQVLRDFTREQRALFVRFVSGRERLPQGIQLKILPDRSNTGSTGAQHLIPRQPLARTFTQQVQTGLQRGGSTSPPSTQTAMTSVGQVEESFDDDRLPHASTCFYWLTLPRYSSVSVMHDKLLYAIGQCTEIDADFRVYDNELGAQPDQPTLTRVTLEAEDEFEDFSHLL